MTKTKNLARIALGAAALTLCAWIAVPTPVPFTMQSMAVFTVAALLGPKLGCASVAVYLLLGAVGMPVFSGFRGGVQALLGPTGGYLIGFLLCAFVTGWTAQKSKSGYALAMGMAAGILLCYGFGSFWYAFVYADGGIKTIFLTCVLPFLLPDAMKLLISVGLVQRIRRSGIIHHIKHQRPL